MACKAIRIKDDVKELKKDGLSFQAISEILGVNKKTAIRAFNDRDEDFYIPEMKSKALYRWYIENNMPSLKYIAEKIGVTVATVRKMFRQEEGTSYPREQLVRLTGLTYEELFLMEEL